MVDPKECLFCRIIDGQIPAAKVYEDGTTFAFLDINPRNPGHTLVIPKKHYETLFDFPETEGGRFFATIKKVASMVRDGTKAHGVSICQNNGSAAGQVVGHLHFHVIPRFLNEGPAALEAILPVKKMDEKSLQKIASAIKGSSPSERIESKREEPVERPLKAEKPEKKPSRRDEEEDVDEFEELGFNV